MIAILMMASFCCDTALLPDKFGSALGVAVGSTNRGVIGLVPVYGYSGIRLTTAGT